MTVELWTLYVATVLALMSTPGPSQLLMLSVSSSHGFRRALMTAAGDLSANALKMLAAGLGLAVLIAKSGSILLVIKWLGVCYLLWLGLRMVLSGGRRSEGAAPSRPSLRQLWLQGFLASAVNPKAVVFFAALFPQFISPDQPVAPQLIVLSVTYIALDACFLTAYGLSASWVVKRFAGGARKWINQVGGGFLIAAAALLALKEVSRR